MEKTEHKIHAIKRHLTRWCTVHKWFEYNWWSGPVPWIRLLLTVTDASTTCAVVTLRVKRCSVLMMTTHVFVITFTGLGSHHSSSQSPSLTEPTPTLTETIKSSPVSGLPSYSSKTRSIYAHTSIRPLLSSQAYPSISSSLDASDDSPNKSVRQKTRHKKKTPIPYWSIAASGIGCMFVILAGYLIWKLSGQTQRGNDTQGPLPDLPQGHDNPVYDGTSMIV